MALSNETHVIMRTQCSDEKCENCQIVQANKLGCLYLGDNSMEFVSPRLPKIQKSGYYQRLHDGGSNCQDTSKVVFVYSADQCRNRFGEMKRNAIMDTFEKFYSKDTQSTRHFFDSERNVAVTMEYSEKDCKGTLIKKDEYDPKKCYFVFSYNQQE